MNSAGKTLCLNMIVKNEMANLPRCLGAVADHIACWVIGDTGSTDGTQDFIRRFFAERGLPGELHSFPFVNFEQARNEALERALASTVAYDYLLFDDADMELVVEDQDFRTKLKAPGYQLIQRAGSGLVYWNARLARRDAGVRYHGVTHEYLDAPGGAQRLQGVWYRDHATGANRVDKFERDARLLREALEREPDNFRYWFYLAQSYRDAGKIREAADTYARRAGMGGWIEEAWEARRQQARCLHDLGDEGGFLSAALAAYNQRPQRAEPLYDLARYYRLKGQNDASTLFSERGLEMALPDGDILFVEEWVYRYGVKEEFSIAANYASDKARKDRGHAVCDWLALSRDVPEQSRDLARWNLFHYVEPLSVMLPSLTARRVDYIPSDGYRPLNPSVARLGDQIVMLLGATTSQPDAAGDHGRPDGGRIHSRNFLLELDASLAIETVTEILPPAGMPPTAFDPEFGCADGRLFAWRGALWCSAAARELTPEGWRQQVLARIDRDAPGICRLTDWLALAPEGVQADEKNWMPRLDGDGLAFIQRCDPVRVLDDAARTVSVVTPSIAADAFRGRTVAIAFDGGWLALIQEVRGERRDRSYQHRFVWFDAESGLRRVSRRFFFFERKAMEFASGLAWHTDGRRLLVSYGIEGREGWIATVEAEEVRGMLRDVEALAGGVRASGPNADDGARQPDRLLPTKVEIDPSCKVPTAVAPQPMERRPPGKVPTGFWVPERPAAGTELMVDGLRQRLGEDLNKVNLNVNSVNWDGLDDRPLVVWFHHDINQVAVQWCHDRALVHKIAMGIFVSDWQKERYVNTYGFPPERCVVLRNATEVPQDVRRWTNDLIPKCAYISTPFRGLSVLLRAWEDLNLDGAELHIWSSMKLYRQDHREAEYEHLYEKARSLSGVKYHGLLPNRELRRALQDFHFLTYPSTFAETSCLGVIEAMGAGCRVIAPYLGALPETTAGYARLYPWQSDHNAHAATFARVLKDEMEQPWDGDQGLSEAQQRHCLATYDWRRREFEWRRLIQDICLPHSDSRTRNERPLLESSPENGEGNSGPDPRQAGGDALSLIT
jgi:glycosyltransferase involved in cell wall biosynthesis